MAGETSVEKEGLSDGRINLCLGRRLDSGQEKSQFRKKVGQWAGETLILDGRSSSAVGRTNLSLAGRVCQ